MNGISSFIRGPLWRVALTVAALVASPITLVSPPALSQGMTSGSSPLASQPRTSPVAKDNAGPSPWSGSTPLAGVGASLTDPSGGRTRRAVSNHEGVLSLGSLSQGTYDIAIELARIGPNQPERQQVLVGVLVSTTQALVGTTTTVVALKGKVRVSIGPNGEPRAITSADGGAAHEDTWDVNRFGAAGGRDLKLVFALPASAPGLK